MKKLNIIIRNSALLSIFLLISFQALANETSTVNALPYYDSAEFTPKWMKSDSEKLEDFHRIPDFSFTDQDGERVTQKSLDNKIYVANFFFSTCPGICPSIRSKLVSVQEKFADDDSIKLISYSIRPTTDTVDILKEYAKKNKITSGKWHLLTGDREEIYSLAKNAYFANEDLGNLQNTNDFLHTENVVLIDTNKHIRGIYNGLNKTSMSHLIADVKLLQKESL